MSLQWQLLPVEDDVSLHELHTLEAGSSQALRQPGSDYIDETTSSTLANTSCHDFPTLSPNLLRTDGPPSTGDGSQLPASVFLLPKTLDRLTEPRHKIVFQAEFLLILGAFSSAIFGGFTIINSTRMAANSLLSASCGSDSTTGIERGFLVDRYAIEGVSFTRAKLLDLAWDTVIGQGLRFVHAWFLYQVIARCLTATMETGTIPHGAYLDLHFSTISFASIWSSFSFIFSRKPVRATRFAIWLILSITYVLGFATIWSATTGYIAGSVPTFNVSTITSVSTMSPDLRPCWVFEDDRVTSNGTRRIITGPPVGDAFGHNPRNLLKASWSHGSLQPTVQNFSGALDFMTKSLIVAALEGVSEDPQAKPLELEDDGWSLSVGADGVSARAWGKSRWATSDIGVWQIERFARTPLKWGVPIGNPGASLENFTGLVARHERFVRNDLVPTNTSNVLPYNSTVWLGGEKLQLEAPFLRGSTACSHWILSALEQCLCLSGVPVESPIDIETPTGCVSDVRYTWGFSSGILGVALILEGFWIFSSWVMWVWAGQHGTLVTMWRPGSGTIRNILDAAEAITEHLGDQHSAYTEKQLSKQLKTSPPFGYLIEERKGFQHIGLRPILTSGGAEVESRKRAKVEKGILYG